MGSEDLKRRMNASPFDVNDEMNALCFLIRSKILETVNTAIPVVVNSVTRSLDGSGASYLSATPLICQTDPQGNAIAQTEIPKLRWFRLQHGNCAVICDPEVGDIGLAVVSQSDVSNLTGGSTPIPPASGRVFDMSDGIYIGGLWGKKPENFVKIESGEITITSTNTVTVNCKTATVNSEKTTINASNTAKIASPETTITGHCTIQGGLNVSGGSGAVVDGSMTTTGDVVANGISLDLHVHGGVQSGGSDTSTPH